ncbi:MAG: hypothetical protein IJF07_06145, partial [Lachnospiraceae bacterium]|nr:hypothetical protein [Lachnospiraceae bacterium]
EDCKLDLERFNELQDNDTLDNLPCMKSYFTMQNVRRYLEKHQPNVSVINNAYGNYQQYKQELDTELRKTTEGFVKIGYLLKVAKDTDILRESGYANVYEFAQAEYNIDKSQVSRFININDRFSENGYSPRLKEHFQGFGHAKLTIMLQLPDEINEELSPEFSKSEIQAIREEYEEEQKISDLEVLMEGEDQEQKDMESNLYKVLHQLGKEQPDLYVKLYDAMYENDEAVQEVLAPDGERIYSVRIMGVGRIMLAVKGLDKPLTLTNMRSGEKEEYEWEDMNEIFNLLSVPLISPEESWAKIYGEEFPQKAKVAPVQPSEQKKETPKKQSKVQKAKKPEPKKVEAKVETPLEQEEQIQGQDNIMNHPEYLPENMQKSPEIPNGSSPLEENVIENVTKNAEIVDKTPLEQAQTPIKTKSEGDFKDSAEIGMELSHDETEDIWERMHNTMHTLHVFFRDYQNETAPSEEIQTAYRNAINLAADLERILNHG